MKTTRTILALLMAALLSFAALPIAVLADAFSERTTYTGTCGPNLTWTFKTNTYTLTISGVGEMYDYFKKDSNSAPWCDYADYIRFVVIEDGVTSIGGAAFYNCGVIASVSVPSTLTRIGDWAFDGCISLASFETPVGLMCIGDNSFAGCISLTEFSLSANVYEIGTDAFRSCISLSAINVDPANGSFSSINGVLFNKGGSVLVCCPGGKNGQYNVPDGTVSIKEGAFGGCVFLTSVTVPNSVLTIGYEAFDACSSLTSVSLGNRLSSIGRHAFLGCEELVSISIPNSVTSIGGGAFAECASLETIEVPDGITRIEYETFSYCSSLTAATIGKNVYSITAFAFYDCTSLNSVTFLGSAPTEFETNVFEHCSNDLCLYYTAQYASSWAPNGETEWNGYPIQMIEDPVTMGDVDGSGSVNANDALVALRYALGLIGSVDIAAADVDGNGVVNANDALTILRAALGLISL